jgi:hypothetical protein
LGKSKKIGKGFQLNGRRVLLVYGDDVNSLSRNINTTKRNAENIVDVCKEVDLEKNAEQTKCHISSCLSSECRTKSKFRYLRTTVTN